MGGFLVLLLRCAKPPVEEPLEPSLSFEFNYHVEFNESGHIQAWIPLPENTRQQTLSTMRIDTDLNMYTAKDGLYGNTFVVVDDQVMAPQSIDISYTVTRREATPYYDDSSQLQMALYQAETSLVPRDVRFDKINASLEGEGAEFGHHLYSYVLEHMSYDKSGEGWGNGDAIFACDIGKGNCTDFHSLFNAVARSRSVPARFKIGFPIPPEKEGEVNGYHCWTEFYCDEKGWVPVDISEADKHPEKTDYYFGHLDERRLELTTGRDIPLPNGRPEDVVNYSVYPYMKLDGIPSSAFTMAFSYREVEIPYNNVLEE